MKTSALLWCILAFTSPAIAQDIDFGDNASEYANDGECDDRRFIGRNMTSSLDWDDAGHDADDCRRGYDLGLIQLWDETKARAATQCSAIRFGNNASEYANDGECDDIRFEGTGSSSILLPDDSGRDAADCKRACDQGTIFLRNY